MKRLVVLALLALSGCENPTIGVGTTISSGSVSISPTVSGRVGGVGVAVSP